MIQVFFNTIIIILCNEQNGLVCRYVQVLIFSYIFIFSYILLDWLGAGITFWTHHL